MRRSETLDKARVTDRELRHLEDEGLVVPIRSWKTLWMVPYYDHSHLSVIQWLATCQRTAETVREQESRLVVADS